MISFAIEKDTAMRQSTTVWFRASSILRPKYQDFPRFAENLFRKIEEYLKFVAPKALMLKERRIENTGWRRS